MDAKSELMKRMVAVLKDAPFPQATRLVVSVSGGMDSMVLLDVLGRMAHVHQAEVQVAHVHHHTGEHAEQAAKLVRDYCAERQFPLTIRDFRWDGVGNFEYTAARFRHDLLDELCGPDTYAVLGHHRGDQAETLLMTLARGAGVATPLGMRLRHEHLLRPMLEMDRHLIADHAQRLQTPHLLDPTNYDRSYFRNAIRHEILPALAAIHGDPEANLTHWLQAYQTQQDALAASAEKRFNTHYRDGLLVREAFAKSEPYLWDFLLRRFWSVQHLSMPTRAAHDQLKNWLQRHETGSLQHEGRHCYCDLDGLCLFPDYRLTPLETKPDQAFDWGPWRLAVTLRAPSRTIRIEPPQTLGKTYRERLRQARIPLRFRGLLPRILIDHESWLGPDWRREDTPLHVVRLAGPKLSWFVEQVQTSQGFTPEALAYV